MLRIRPKAEAELSEAYTWYAERGLAEKFIEVIETVLHQIQEQPMAYPVVYRDVRRALVRRFRYAIFYVIEPNALVVLAVMHQSRDPARWQGRR